MKSLILIYFDISSSKKIVSLFYKFLLLDSNLSPLETFLYLFVLLKFTYFIKSKSIVYFSFK